MEAVKNPEDLKGASGGSSLVSDELKDKVSQQEQVFLQAINGSLWLEGDELKIAVNQALIEEDDKSKEREELFSCIVCRCLVFEPMRCSNAACDQLFCKGCAQILINRNMSCPRCRKPTMEVTELSRMFKRVIEREYVICSCGKGMLYEELLDHVHICAGKSIPCPLSCGAEVSLLTYKEHFKSQCNQVLSQCQKCKAILPKQAFEQEPYPKPASPKKTSRGRPRSKAKNLERAAPVKVKKHDCLDYLLQENSELREACKGLHQKNCQRSDHEWNIAAQVETDCTIVQKCMHCAKTKSQRKPVPTGHSWMKGKCCGERCKDCKRSKVAGVSFYDEHVYRPGCQNRGQKCEVCNDKTGDFIEHEWREVNNMLECGICHKNSNVFSEVDEDDYSFGAND